MGRQLMTYTAVLLMSLQLLSGEPGERLWRLAFEDTFERKELGRDWEMIWGNGRIVDGRLFITGNAATAMVKRAFASDVTVTFEAEVDPAQPPCDVACGLAGNPVVGYGYLLQFGGNNNQCNQLICPLKNRGLNRTLQINTKPPFRIEYGKRYRCVAVKEGPRITYEVNGVRLLDVTDRDVLGGPNLDHIAIVTWNGLSVDNVRVFERAEPAPGGPVYIKNPAVLDIGYRWDKRVLTYRGKKTLAGALTRAIEAYNKRRYEAAYELFAGITPPTIESAVGFSYVIGDLGFPESETDQQKAAALAARAARPTTRLPLPSPSLRSGSAWSP